MEKIPNHHGVYVEKRNGRSTQVVVQKGFFAVNMGSALGVLQTDIDLSPMQGIHYVDGVVRLDTTTNPCCEFDSGETENR